MELLIFLIVYMGIGLATFPVATRLIYNRESAKYGPEPKQRIAAYRDSLVVGGACAVFWPVAAPAGIIAVTAMATARVTAPPEIKKLVSQHNSLMLERQLGMIDDEIKQIVTPDDIMRPDDDDYGYR